VPFQRPVVTTTDSHPLAPSDEKPSIFRNPEMALAGDFSIDHVNQMVSNVVGQGTTGLDVLNQGRRIGHTEFVRVLRLHNLLKVLAQTGSPVVEGKWWDMPTIARQAWPGD
jgi:hypothetical protein